MLGTPLVFLAAAAVAQSSEPAPPRCDLSTPLTAQYLASLSELPFSTEKGGCVMLCQPGDSERSS